VAFVGQVYVKVRGAVKSGHYIVASGKNDGVGYAVSKKDLTAEDTERIVGQAWETSNNPNLRLVKAAITWSR
jgi:hypothetical protein